MKKTYPLHVEGKNPDRLLEATKHEIRKYIKREQNKPCPAGVDFWDFDCRFGSSPATAETIHLGALTERINAYAAEKAESFYVELLAKPRCAQAAGSGREPRRRRAAAKTEPPRPPPVSMSSPHRERRQQPGPDPAKRLKRRSFDPRRDWPRRAAVPGMLHSVLSDHPAEACVAWPGGSRTTARAAPEPAEL